ncbi:methyltransferase domain-containing protein [Vallitalea pronyensis]|uniref:Methyltransferase domain-containing protein n=1 Tax=Vallitalea pronyensis TaxID=1348613 RepID=A0A8J8SHY3_9FIRM|nr:MerR family transcriptional regulator [Vallitalea pronyensis]QUI23892.1 methyltransferase domain-containing protein [Vallitalea pronyensis]
MLVKQPKTYTVGEFAKKAGVTIRTLRYYDNINMLQPTTHNDLGHRLYSDSDFQKLQKIMTLKFVGFSLAEIKDVMASPETSINDTLRMQKQILYEKKQHINMVIDAINETSKMLEDDEQDFQWEKFNDIIQVIHMEKDWIADSRKLPKQNDCMRIHERFSTNNYGWRKWLYDQLGYMKNCHILDVGCGEAKLWSYNSQRLHDNMKVSLMDISEEVLNHARMNLKDDGKVFQFHLGDAEELPYEDNTFDKVIADHMIYYVRHFKRALSEIHRVLKPNGKIYVSATGQAHLKELPRLLSHFNDDIRLTGFSLKRFNLENGKEHLSKWFQDVHLNKYGDSLMVTEVEPLLQYMLSATGNMRDILEGKLIDAFRGFLEKRMEQDGGLHITKDIGLFIGTKGCP